MGVYIELPKEWARWSFDVVDIHCNSLVPKVTDLDLVRCGECKHYEHEICRLDPFWERYTEPNDFCSQGERRE